MQSGTFKSKLTGCTNERSLHLTILKNKSFSNISLRNILTIPFILQIILIAGLVGYFSFQNGQQAVKEIAHQLHDKINTHIEGHLKHFLATSHQINQLNANAFYQELPYIKSLENLEHYFWKQIQVFDSVSSISFGYKEGGIVNAGREEEKESLYVISTDTFKKGSFNKYATDSQGNRASLLVTVPNFDSRTRPWYLKAVEKKGAVWSNIYVVFTGHDMAISASLPVYDKHQNLLGVTLNDIFLSHISDFLKNLQIGKTGYAFIMEKSGLLVASSFDEKPFVAENGKKTKRRLHAHESSEPIIKYAAKFLTQQTGEYKNINSSVQLEFTIDNKLYYLQASPIHDPYGIEWINVVVIPESDFMVQINANKRTTILLIIIAVLLTLVIGVFTARWISKPILRLNKSTQSLTKGEFKTIDRERVREIDQLGQSFNFMARQLEQTVLKLKTQIAEREQSETALRKSKKQFQDLFNSINDLIYTQDMEGHFIAANPAMQRLFGYSMDEFIGRRATEFMKPEFESDFDSHYLEVIKKQGNHNGISCYLKKNKEKIYIEYNSSLVEPDDGNPYISGIGRDVTGKILSERKVKKLQKQVAQAQKMESIGTLAGGIAHDFNNILFPILGYSEMLLADIPEDSPFKHGLNQIYTGSLRASELVKQILTFSRQESGELRLIKIQPIIKEALKLLRSTIPTTIKIKQKIQSDCGAIKADSTRIHQIIMNLTTNAYHAMEENGGEIKINLKEVEFKSPDLFNPDIKPGAYACLSISDTGKGMDKELIEKIFDPFFTTKETGKGTGMGLSVVHGVVKNMDGAIHVYSEPEKGTEFRVYLPLSDSVKEQQVAYTQGLIQGGTEHILVVDDEKAIIEMEQDVLERLGYKVTSRSSSLEALEAFRAAPDKFDLVITDMQMPNMSGDRLSSELTKIRPDIPILLCTGFSETMSEEKAISLGIKGFLLKPIVMKDFSQKIREVLDENKA